MTTTTNSSAAYGTMYAKIFAEIEGYRYGSTPAHVADERAAAAAADYATTVDTSMLIVIADMPDMTPQNNIAAIGMMMRRDYDPRDIVNEYVRVALRDTLTDRMVDRIGVEPLTDRLDRAGAYALSLTTAEAGAFIAAAAREIFATDTA